MRIESAFIADHAEVSGYPDTRCSVRVPELYQGAEASFRHVLALALVIQAASDDCGRAFTLGIDVDRVDELR